VALVTKGSEPKVKGPFMANRLRKVSMSLKTLDQGKVLPRNKRLRAIETRV